MANCYRYLVFNNTFNYSHEIITDKFYGYNIGKKPIGKRITVWDESDHTESDVTIEYYEDTVYNKTKEEYEQLKRERAEREEATA